jgi:predicted secreted protein
MYFPVTPISRGSREHKRNANEGKEEAEYASDSETETESETEGETKEVVGEAIAVTLSGGIQGLGKSGLIQETEMSPSLRRLWTSFVSTTQFRHYKMQDDCQSGSDMLIYTIRNGEHQFQTNSGAAFGRTNSAAFGCTNSAALGRTNSGAALGRTTARRDRYRAATSFVDAVLKESQEKRNRGSDVIEETSDSDEKSGHLNEKIHREREIGNKKKPTLLKIGGKFEVRRFTNGSTGYAWKVASSSNLRLVEEGTERTEKSKLGMSGAGAYQTWTFLATKPAGPGLIYMLYKRSWEPDLPTDTQERIHFTIE